MAGFNILVGTWQIQLAQLIGSIYVQVYYPNPVIHIESFPFVYPYPVQHYMDLHNLQTQLQRVMYLCIATHFFCFCICVFLLIPRYMQMTSLRNFLQGLGFLASL